MIRAVIFDFNGVLVDDEIVHFELFREVLQQEGVTIDATMYHDRYLGYDDRGCFDAALRDGGQTADAARLDELIARKGKRYFEVAEQGLKFFPKAAETLTALAARWPVAINSGALRAEIEFSLRKLNIRQYVEAIVSAEDPTHCKPHPEGYQLALAALQKAHPDLKAEECMVIEDSLQGVLSALGAGMKAVGVETTYTASELLATGANAVAESLAVITPEWVEATFGRLETVS